MPDGKPLTVRFDVVNMFDTIYQIRNGTGIGVFAPQYRPAPRLLHRHQKEDLKAVPVRGHRCCTSTVTCESAWNLVSND